MQTATIVTPSTAVKQFCMRMTSLYADGVCWQVPYYCVAPQPFRAAIAVIKVPRVSTSTPPRKT